MKKLLLELLFLIVTFGGAWYGFTKLKLAPEDFTINLSIENEEKLGKLIIKGILESEEPVENPVIDSAVQIIFKRLESGLDSSQFHYKFHVLRNDQVNALTLPGGNIIIYTGLIEFADSPEELAAVIAHEMGHVENRDVVFKLVKEIGVAVILTVILNGDYGLISEIGKMIVSTVFDREQEARADQFAFELMAETGIKPYAMASFFRRLADEKGSYDEKLEILMTHPHDKKRIKAAIQFKMPEGFIEQKFTDLNWNRVQDTVMQL